MSKDSGMVRWWGIWGLLLAVALAGCNGNGSSADGDSANTEASTADDADSHAAEEGIPEVVTSGPKPKAVVPETEYNFGVMEYGSEGSHTFLIKNEGEAPLKMVAREEDTTCQCTVGSVSKEGLQPGETGEVTLTWEIKSNASEFRHRALVRTNDPENSVIELTISGRVENVLVMRPEGTWQIGEVNDEEPTIATGRLYSSIVDEFNITNVTSSEEKVKLTYEPLSEEALKELEAKCGYELTATVEPGFPVGPVSARVNIETDLKDGLSTSFRIRGTRSGPVKVIARGWHADANVLDLGEFPASTGATREMAFFFKSDEPVELVDVEKDPKSLNVTWTHDEAFQGKSKKYILTIEVPPGPPQVRNRANIAKVLLKTDHPDVEEFKVFISFVAF